MNEPGQFDWNHIRAFVATAETGSLSGAARKLELTQPTLSRQIAALEQDLGVMLFERVGRSLELTDAGRELLSHSKAMDDAANRVSLSALGQAHSIEGKVRITATDVLSTYNLPPVLERLRDAAPKLEIEVIAANDLRDLMRREADIAVRHVRPDQPDLIARLVQEATASLYGATRYLDRNGRPQTKEDLKHHDFINFGDTGQTIDFFAQRGIYLTPDNLRLGSQSGVVSWELVKTGLGLSLMADAVGTATAGIERIILEDMEPVVFPIWLVAHRELHSSKKLRLVFDLLAEFLSATDTR